MILKADKTTVLNGVKVNEFLLTDAKLYCSAYAKIEVKKVSGEYYKNTSP